VRLKPDQGFGFALESLVVLRLQGDFEHALTRLRRAFTTDLQGQTGTALAKASNDLKAIEFIAGVGLQRRGQGRSGGGQRLFERFLGLIQGGQKFVGRAETILGRGPGGKLNELLDFGQAAVDHGRHCESRPLFALGHQIVATDGGRLARKHEIGNGAERKEVEFDGRRPGRVTGFRRQVDLLRHAIREHFDV